MSSGSNRISSLIQYALLVAGEEDAPFDRQLGPIHFIKYVYLADLFYANRNDGNTYTEIDWQFYNFGPWSTQVYEIIEPALREINAEKMVMESDYGDQKDWVRWSLRDENLLESKGREIPSAITLHLLRLIHKFGKDTASLLDFVYKTAPMLAAAPNELLDFTLVVDKPLVADEESEPLRMDGLSNKKKKKLKEKMREIQEANRTRKSIRDGLVNPFSDSIKDEVYKEGMEWLDSLAGPEIIGGKNIAQFTEDVWKSKTRKGKDVS